MKQEAVVLLMLAAFAIGCVCGYAARSAVDPAPPTSSASTEAPPVGESRSSTTSSSDGQSSGDSTGRVTSPNRATARAYSIEFIRRALKHRDSTDVAFANMRLKADGENAWRVTGVYRPDAATYDFRLRVWAVHHEGQWIWSCKDLVIGGKEFPDEINFQDHTAK